MPGIFDVIRAQLHSTYYWYKNNKGLFFMMVVWPYLMVGMIFFLGGIFGNPKVYAERMGVGNPILFLFSASIVAQSTINIIDSSAGFVIYNRWIGTLTYIFLSPIKHFKIILFSGLPEALLGSFIALFSITPVIVYYVGLLGLAELFVVFFFIILGMIPMLGISVLISLVTLWVKEESNILNSLVPFILLLSGVFYPIKILPTVLQYISSILPVPYVVEAVKLIGTLTTGFGEKIFFTILVVTLLGLGYNAISIMLVRAGETRLRARGIE